MNDLNKNFFNGINLKLENYSLNLEPIDYHFARRNRILGKKSTKWDPYLPKLNYP